ncbi:MAG: hypothetical protein D6760_10775 [Deltaproteobacteria bacterium]|nr:MAG: hypothetical protein D6760_10775 [Deltaproteobacteria bacterium]
MREGLYCDAQMRAISRCAHFSLDDGGAASWRAANVRRLFGTRWLAPPPLEVALSAIWCAFGRLVTSLHA